MADDDVADVGTLIPRLVEYRVRQLEKNQEKMMERMEKLATAAQLTELKDSLNDRAKRGFTFWVMIVGGPVLAGVIVGVILMGVAGATGVPHATH